MYFIEVKFRANGEFIISDLPTNYTCENAYIVIVSKKHLKCITVSELKEGKENTPTSQNYLGNRNEFDHDKSIIIEFYN